MRIEFPLGETETEFGPLVDPTIILPVKTLKGYRPFEFVLDSGADFTMVPRVMATRVGVDLAGAPELLVRGIEGSGVAADMASISVRIGEQDVELPCLFYSHKNAPYLLGRMGFFSRFNITFDNRGKRIVLEEIDS